MRKKSKSEEIEYANLRIANKKRRLKDCYQIIKEIAQSAKLGIATNQYTPISTVTSLDKELTEIKKLHNEINEWESKIKEIELKS